MQMLRKFCKKAQSSLSFSYEDTVTEGTKLRPVDSLLFLHI